MGCKPEDIKELQSPEDVFLKYIVVVAGILGVGLGNGYLSTNALDKSIVYFYNNEALQTGP
ncbi:hypothetical protein IH992_06860 [Candidatus Poribacteria bacterium]|nr:hypothetical protein [Candidatus Poribacteria bacterium]